MSSGFKLGAGSMRELDGVHPDLVLVVGRALDLSPIDFSVHDGLRTLEEQREYVRTGASHTLQSRHLKQPDGFGHAVDLVPYVNGKLRWEWPLIYPIAAAVQQAAGDHDVSLIWGGVWDRKLEELDDLKAAVAAYSKRFRARGNRQVFLDGPHFELA